MPNNRRWRIAVAVLLVLLALGVRAIFFKYETGDYSSYFHSWYEFIDTHGKLGALKYSFANYNEPYLYLLAILTYTPLSALLGIKLISVTFDIILAYFTYRIVRLRHPQGWLPMAAMGIILFLPTVVLNSSLWGQIDASYTSFGLGGLYFALRRRPWLACLFFGVALSFKLQIIFLFPLLALLVLRRWMSWRPLLLIPAAFVALDLPALLIGASVSTLWSTYTGEVGLYHELTLNAPNIYQYLGITESNVLRDAGIAFTALLVLGLIAWAVIRRVELTPTRIVLAGTVSVLIVPYFLPAMHERYFYMADALTVIAAFYLPRRRWALAVLEQFASLLSYMPFLLATTTVAGASVATGAGLAQGQRGGGGGGIQPAASGAGGSAGRGGVAGQGPPGGFPGNGHQRAGGGGAGRGGVPHDSGLGGLGAHTVVSFKILSSVMLAAVVLSLWAAIREFRSPKTAPVVEPTLAGATPRSGVEPQLRH
jgi:Gpi18-like mannosyltransferase